eukprot:7115047-Ditylum_brightwellii.AAC.1
MIQPVLINGSSLTMRNQTGKDLVEEKLMEVDEIKKANRNRESKGTQTSSAKRGNKIGEVVLNTRDVKDDETDKKKSVAELLKEWGKMAVDTEG